MAKVFITLTGTKHYFGNDFLEKGTKIRLEKEPDNEYDKEAIKVTYEGRKRLRYVLYEAAISLIGQNAEFKEIHRYYLTRQNNPLKKMESVIAVACKALRVFYAILTKGVSYDGKFMLESIRYPENQVLGNRIAA